MLAALAAVGSAIPAHATHPGENGPIVFTSVSTSPPSIARVRPGGADIEPLAAQGTAPRVSPNGKKIAYLVGSTSKDVHVMNIDGTHKLQLTSGLNVNAVTWVADGSKLAYVAAAAPSSWASSMWTMNPDGTNKSYVRDLKNGLKFSDLDFSPNPDLFAYADGVGNLWADSLSGNSPSLLDSSTAYKPSWAPDGASILYGSGSDSFLLKEYVVASGVRRIIQENATRSRTVVSPDGTLLSSGFGTKQELTTRARAGDPITFSWPVATIDVDWARVPKNCHVTTPKQGDSGVLGGFVDFYADQCVVAVSPNPAAAGGVLAQAMAVGPDGRVYASALRNDPFGAPVWGPYSVVPGVSSSPSGVLAKKIAIAAAGNGSFQVVIVNAADDSLYHAMQYPNGKWSGFNLLDGVGGPRFAARDVAITINASSPTSAGNAQVIANGLTAGGVYHRARWPDGSWTPFAAVPGAQHMNTQAIAIASSDDGYTNVLAITTAADRSQGQIQHVLRHPSGNWTGWVTMPVPVGTPLTQASDVAIARTNSQASVMFLDAENRAYFQVRDNPNQTASWQTQLSANLITTQGRTVSISQGSPSQVLVTRVYPQP